MGRLVAKIEGKEIRKARKERLLIWRERVLFTRPVEGLRKWRKRP